MADLVPSLQLLSERVLSERRELRAHADALDAKIGLALGISGVLAAVPNTIGAIGAVGRCLAGAAALLCLAALYPRPYGTLDLPTLRDSYLTKGADVTRLEVLDTDVGLHLRDATKLDIKVRLLKAALVVLLLAIGVSVAGIVS